MKKNSLRNFFYFLISGAIVLSAISCQQKHPIGIEHVIVIGLDGLSVQGMLEAHTPCMDSLMQNGAYSFKVRSVIPTVSLPNWAAMVNGAGPEITGVTTNDWERDFDNCPPVSMSQNHVFPNIFSVIREQMPDAETGAIYEWGGFKRMLETEVINKFESYSNQRETAEKSAEYILEKRPNLLFIQLDKIDGFGHSKGHMSPEYIEFISETDKDVQLIVDAVKQAGINDKTMIMVVSDHGGIFYAHGGYSYEEFTTPIIYSGKGIKKNYHIQQQIYRYDVAADVIFALGLKIPQVWVGRPVKAAFEGFNEPENLYRGTEVLPPPVFVNDEMSTRYGYLTIDKGAEVIIKKPLGVNGEIHYTTDGAIPTRNSTVYTAPFTLDHSALVKAKIYGEEGESPTITAQYRVVYSNKGNGLNYSFYHLPGEKSLPLLQSRTAIAKGVCYEVSFKQNAFPDLNTLREKYNTDCGIRFDGWIEIDEEAKYTFRIWGRGGYRLFVNSQKIIEHTTLNEGMNMSGSIDLKKGIYPFQIDYFSSDDRGYLDLYYEVNGESRGFIPGNMLYRQKVPVN